MDTLEFDLLKCVCPPTVWALQVVNTEVVGEVIRIVILEQVQFAILIIALEFFSRWHIPT